MENKVLKRGLSLMIMITLVITMFAIPIAHDNTVNAATKKYKVTYKANGGKFTAKKYSSKKTVIKKIKKDKKLGTAPKIKKENYVFLGWYTKKSGGKKYTKATKVTKKTTLYARWSKKFTFKEKYISLMGQKFSNVDELGNLVGKLTKTPDSYKGKKYKILWYVDKSDNQFGILQRNGESTIELYCVGAKVKDFVNTSKAFNYKTFVNKFGGKIDIYSKEDAMVFASKNGMDWSFDVNKKTKKIGPNSSATVYTRID